MYRHRLLGLLLLCQPACQAQPPPTTPAATPAAERREVPDARERLQGLLAQIPRPGPVLGALDAPQRERFDTLLESLSDEELEILRAPDGPIVQERPLLHLMAGGRSASAFLSLATTSSAANELLSVTPQGANLEGVLTTTNEVILRASREWLRGAAEHLGANVEVDVPFCEAVDRVAATLKNPELRCAARELWLAIDPSPAARLNLARAAIWAGDRALARAEYETVVQGDPQSSRVQLYAAQMRELLSMAERSETPARGVDQAVLHARTHLILRHPAQAARVLEPYAAKAHEHLGLSTLRVLSAHPDLPCAGVRAGLGNAPLCAYALEKNVFGSKEYGALEPAWSSGKGRTAESIQDYLGLMVVLPWKSRLLESSSQPATAERARKLAGLSRAASSVSPEFAGLELFSRALWAGAGAAAAAPGSTPTIAAPLERELLKDASTMGDADAEDMRRIAALAVAALLSHQSDVRELYRSIAPFRTPAEAWSQVALGAWLAAAFSDAPLFESVKARAIEVLGQADSGSLAGSTLVLLLAEAANLVEPSPDNAKTLEQVTGELLEARVPAALRMRAALNLAHLKQRAGQAEHALELLRDAAAIEALEGPGPDTATWRLLVRARLALVDGDGLPASAQLSEFQRVFVDQSVPPSVHNWLARWVAEFEARVARQACGARRACLEAVERTHEKALADLERSTPSISGRLMARGAFTLGSLEMTIDYQPTRGLTPIVQAEPALVFLPLPPTATPK